MAAAEGTVGDTFESIGYRPVNMTDPTAANLFRVLWNDSSQVNAQ